MSALLAVATFKEQNTQEVNLVLIDDLIAKVAHIQSDGEINLSRKQIGSLKGKYIYRLGSKGRRGKPDKPNMDASRCELLVELDKGKKSPGERAGKPTEYRLTGLGYLLSLGGDIPEHSLDPPCIERYGIEAVSCA